MIIIKINCHVQLYFINDILFNKKVGMNGSIIKDIYIQLIFDAHIKKQKS